MGTCCNAAMSPVGQKSANCITKCEQQPDVLRRRAPRFRTNPSTELPYR
jgi:hypothetical protein